MGIPTAEQEKTKAHCNDCGGDKNHTVLFIEESRWSDDEHGEFGWETFEMIKCGGCDSVKLRQSWWSTHEHPDTAPSVRNYPPPQFRKEPSFISWSPIFWDDDSQSVGRIMKEVYVAVQNDALSLAAMGIRAALEHAMVTKCGDRGSFMKNLKAFEETGHVSRKGAERIETILEAGHATIHRAFQPEWRDIVVLLNITEHVLESVYAHDIDVNDLKKRVPPRAPKIP